MQWSLFPQLRRIGVASCGGWGRFSPTRSHAKRAGSLSLAVLLSPPGSYAEGSSYKRHQCGPICVVGVGGTRETCWVAPGWPCGSGSGSSCWVPHGVVRAVLKGDGICHDVSECGTRPSYGCGDHQRCTLHTWPDAAQGTWHNHDRHGASCRPVRGQGFSSAWVCRSPAGGTRTGTKLQWGGVGVGEAFSAPSISTASSAQTVYSCHEGSCQGAAAAEKSRMKVLMEGENGGIKKLGQMRMYGETDMMDAKEQEKRRLNQEQPGLELEVQLEQWEQRKVYTQERWEQRQVQEQERRLEAEGEDRGLSAEEPAWREKRPSSAAEYFGCLTKGLPICVGQAQVAGRGVFATRDIAAGEIVHRAIPVVAHPTLANVSKVCYLCLRKLGSFGVSSLSSDETDSERSDLGYQNEFLDPGNRCVEDKGRVYRHGDSQSHSSSSSSSSSVWASDDDGGPQFCSSDCEVMAESDFYAVEKKADWSQYNALCREHGLKFPLIAARLACMVISGAVPSTVLRPLCYVALDPPIPSMWQEEHRVLTSTLQSVGVPPECMSFLTPEWYASVLSKLHLNAFRIEILNEFDPSNYWEAAAAAVCGDKVGTGLYLLPSMYNHDCEPNVHISWEMDATAKIEAQRDIAVGEELRITYVDATMSRDMRREQLEWSYGFLCECSRCGEGD